ncbi:MAG TPA: 50S ribosomal protein L11 methyltransferase [Anaerolineales bacterium]|nr:50S ribosomal protein L11 methyltransferase [Anaerolineales bacterium]
MNWLEVSLTVDGELAESVADVFSRFAPNGVMTEQGVAYNDAEDPGTPAGPITVRAYLEVNDRLEETRQKLEESLFYLGMIRPLPNPAYRQIADQNWMEAWKQHYKPILIGEHLLILPAWMDSPDPNRIAIKIDPGMAFGTGTHPTTQLCLELMERMLDLLGLKDLTGLHVIDIGCGSGILSIAAIKLGAKQALGVDIDGESIVNSRENAETNRVGKELILGVGSVAEILAGQFPLKSAPLVVANILAPVIVRLFDAGMVDLIEGGGAIILSGILLEQEGSLLEAGQAHGLGMIERRQMGDWVALTMTRQSPHEIPSSKTGMG